ncbi:hypothetical protein MTBUT4_1070002 [Magnetospirillum sp. UT-4]|nr:hypothetical protein MTBUT4_1070002 [Magnetospirillum sp. UT-4]
MRFATAKALVSPGLGRADARRPHPGSLALAPLSRKRARGAIARRNLNRTAVDQVRA